MALRSPIIAAVAESFDDYGSRWRRILESESPLKMEFPKMLVKGEPESIDIFAQLSIVKALAPGKFV
jgi:hypothetical protein